MEVEVEPIPSIELHTKDEFNKRFKPKNQQQNNSSRTQTQSSLSAVSVEQLRAEDIKEHRLWALGSTIACFFLVSPFIALYNIRRIRQMKKNQELTTAQGLSNRVNNMLIITNIIGGIVWLGILFVIGVLFVMGALY